jgi:hypothetical protein
LAADSVLEELPGDRFGLTALGACLRDGVPGSLRGAISARGDLYFRAAAGLLDAVREGGVAFERAHGNSLIEFVPILRLRSSAPWPTDPGRKPPTSLRRSISESFAGSWTWAEARACSWRRFSPQPPGCAVSSLTGLRWLIKPEERLGAAGVTERCTFVGGDFFVSVPPGGDAYLLSRVIHDWDDEMAQKILTTCHRTMEDNSTLLLVDAILPERARENPAAIRMDLHMLMLLEGRERTGAEFERLLSQCEFRLTRIVSTRSLVGLGIVETVRTTT